MDSSVANKLEIARSQSLFSSISVTVGWNRSLSGQSYKFHSRDTGCTLQLSAPDDTIISRNVN